MKIYTKGGDKGKTSLVGGTRVSKYSLRIESYGTVDELNAHIGLIRDSIDDTAIKEQIITIQDRLFTIGANLASEPRNKMPLPPIQLSDITYLEDKIDEMDSQLEPLRKFVLPGGHLTVSLCHVCRTICRRAERLIVGLSNEEDIIIDENIIPYINRLSDYLFVLSRFMTMRLNAEEIAWTPKM